MGRLYAALGSAAGLLLLCSTAFADGKCPAAPRAPAVTWGATSTAASAGGSRDADESPVSRARELVASARFLDDSAAVDEKSAADLSTRLPALKTAAKAARDKADRATGEEKETLVARAEHLEADVVVSEAEVAERRRSAATNRRVARDLRARAVKIVRDAATTPEEREAAMQCDPPYRYTLDGRKIYRLECLK